MSILIRFKVFLFIFEEWKEKACPENSFSLLACIGFFNRINKGLLSSKIEEIEKKILKELENTINLVFEFFNESTLLVRAKNLSANNIDKLLDFYVDRDEAQLVWDTISKYSNKVEITNFSCMNYMQDILDLVDNEILFNKELVKKLREIGRLEPVCTYDKDFFWWLPQGHKRESLGRCYLPRHRQEQYLASFYDRALQEPLLSKYEEHFKTCEDCQEQFEMLKKNL